MWRVLFALLFSFLYLILPALSTSTSQLSHLLSTLLPPSPLLFLAAWALLLIPNQRRGTAWTVRDLLCPLLNVAKFLAVLMVSMKGWGNRCVESGKYGAKGRT